MTIYQIAQLVSTLVNFYETLIIIYILLSWFPIVRVASSTISAWFSNRSASRSSASSGASSRRSAGWTSRRLLRFLR